MSRSSQERPLRDRTNPGDPMNTTLPPGQQAHVNNFGMSRQINDVHSNLTDQLQQLEAEKISLMKRLNMVLSELETATHEKSDIAQRLREQEHLAEELKRKLEEVSSLKNVVNRNLQDDLKYERDLNIKLREELDRFETEKNSLLEKLREEEELASQIQRETDNVNSNLLRKTDDLQRLEADHEATGRRIRDLNSELEHLRTQEVKNRQLKLALDEQLQDLTNQRNDLIRRMNELSDKYETYVSQMNAERIDTQHHNKQHVKTLVAKLLFQILDENIRRKKKLGFAEISSTAKIMINLETKVNKLQRVLGNYVVDRKRFYLRVWYRKAFNVVHENYKRNTIIDNNVSHKNKQKFFFLWRQLYLNRKRIYANKISAIKMIDRMSGGQAQLKLRHFFCRWRDFNQHRETQEDFMMSICWRRALRAKRQAFVKWIANIRHQDMVEKQEKLTNIITETTFKQRVFLAFKHAVQQERQEMADRKFQAWKNWCDQSRKDKFFARKEALVENIFGVRTERLLKSCFDAIRFSNQQMKFETTRMELESKIPEREELEFKRECLAKQTATKTKYHALRQCYLKYVDVKYKALMTWKENCQFYHHNMDRVKLRLIEQHKRRLNWAFMKWKEGADKGIHMEMMVMTEDIMNENQNLSNELTKKKEIREKQAVKSGRQQVDKLERIRNMFNRKSMRNYFERWVDGALRIQNLDQAMTILNKTEKKHRLRYWLFKFRSQAKASRRETHINSRCDWLDAVRKNGLLKDCMATWKENARKHKLGKKFLNRAVNGMQRNEVGMAFKKWKNAQAADMQMMQMEEVASMENVIQGQNLQIDNKRREIESCKSGKLAIVAKSKDLSKKVMANYLVRAQNMQYGRGFYTWLENTRDANQKKRTLKKAMIYWMKSQLMAAFRTWQGNHFSSIQGELDTQLQETVSARRDLVHAGEEASRQQANEIATLTQTLNTASANRDQVKSNFKNAFGTFMARKQGNVYVPKKENIFLEWVAYIRKEKAAVNVIGAIARLTLRREVFQRIRAAAREKYLDDRAIQTANKFFLSFKNSNLRKAWNRWRENSKQAVLTQLVMTQTHMEEVQTMQVEEMNRINDVKVVRADRTIKRAQVRKMNTAMMEMLRILKALRVKQETLKQNVAYMKGKRAMQKWFQRTQITLYLRRRNQQVIDTYKKKRLQQLWDGIRQHLFDERQAGNMMSRLINRMQYFDQAKAFQHWQQQTISMKTRANEDKDQGLKTIGHILNRLVKKRLADALHDMRMRTEKRDFKDKFLRRMLMHVGEYRKRYFWDRWKNVVRCEKISEDVNTEGEVVMKRNQLARQARCMKDQLVKMGYTPEFIDEYLETKAAKQRSDMQKGIISLFFKNSDFSIVPKAFNQLKAYVQERRAAKQRALQAINWMNHPLAVYFRKWKYDMADAESKLKGLSKQELIDKIIADENLIGSTESRLDRMGNSIDTLAFQRENLFGHFVRGQKLAVALCKNNYLKSVWRAFMRWKRFNADFENMRLIEQLERTNQMINDLQDHVGKLESINKNLLGENEELRQAALDGIEISNVVQELTKEREGLSNDLQDRAGTIKKLIEDNNNLSIKLNIAQQEAQQLESINQQAFSGPPERDY